MRKITFLLLFMGLLIQGVSSQTTKGFNYQAVVRDNNGQLVASQSISVQLTVIASTAGGDAIYSESHTVSSNPYGVINLKVGSGKANLGSFESINWSGGDRYLNVKIDAGDGLTDFGTVQLLSVPYAMYADAAGKADALGSASVYTPATDTLFVVKDHDGNVVFAVFPDGAQVIVNETAKGKVGGFAVSGRNPSKATDVEIMRITPDSSRIYVNDTVTNKGKVGGFAVSGRNPSKNTSADILFVTADSTRIYVNDNPDLKGKVGGFAVSGRNPSKGIISDYLQVTKDSTRVYVEESLIKGKVGGFAVSGRNPSKGSLSDYLQVTKDSTRVYVEPSGTKGKVGGFAVSGRNPSKGNVTQDYFNISANLAAETIDNESRIMWYPQKSAFIGGEVHVGSSDSVGTNSAALGYRSIAKGDWSQAFGYKSLAYGTFSTAMGYEAESNTNSFAVGYLAKANGSSSFAMGYGAIAAGDNSYALGSVGLDSAGFVTNNTQAIGEYSFAFGLGSVTTGKGSVAFGTNNTSSGEYSTTIGYKNTASKWYTTSIGSNSKATGLYATAIGFYNEADTTASIALGYATKAHGHSSLATGYATTAVGYSSIAGGYGTNAGGFSALAMGYLAQAPGDYSFSAGWSTNSSNTASAAFGRSTTSGGQYSLVYGYNSSTNASGTYSLAGGNGCTANSSYSVALGRNCTTSASYATAIGFSNTASGLYSVALGRSSTASGIYSVSSGYGSAATGDYSFSAGNVTTAQAYMSAVFGRYNVVAGTTDSWETTEPIFVVGNGSSGLPSNALTLLKDGDMTIGGDLFQNSDKRLKENIMDMSRVLPNVLEIKPIYYEFKNKETHSAGRHIGFIAQDVQKYYPELVSKGPDGMLSLDYSRMTVVLLKAINEQQELIEKQQEENYLLKLQIEEINRKLDQLINK